MESIEISEVSKKNDSHACNCADEGASSYPELDATLIPHSVRHAAIFGALDSLKVGNGMILLAPHKPVPLLSQLEERSPGAFGVTFLSEGPEKWHVQFIRQK